MHLVHKNSKYATLDDAFKNADGVAILAFFLTQSFTKQPFKVRKIHFGIDELASQMGLRFALTKFYESGKNIADFFSGLYLLAKQSTLKIMNHTLLV